MEQKKENFKVHIMIDLETLGTKAGCSVVQIGAVACFEGISEGELSSKYRITPTLKLDIKDNSGSVDLDTIAWHMNAEEDQRKAIANAMTNGFMPKKAAGIFFNWFTKIKNLANKQKFNVWCQGGSFDFPILADFLERNGYEKPWEYWQERDLRTIAKMLFWVKRDTNFGTKHTALDDAISQMNHLKQLLPLFREMFIANAKFEQAEGGCNGEQNTKTEEASAPETKKEDTAEETKPVEVPATDEAVKAEEVKEEPVD